jgi:hypothetical protein
MAVMGLSSMLQPSRMNIQPAEAILGRRVSDDRWCFMLGFSLLV